MTGWPGKWKDGPVMMGFTSGNCVGKISKYIKAKKKDTSNKLRRVAGIKK
jgi:hypothetical protein